jgi:hypothetical protein
MSTRTAKSPLPTPSAKRRHGRQPATLSAAPGGRNSAAFRTPSASAPSPKKAHDLTDRRSSGPVVLYTATLYRYKCFSLSEKSSIAAPGAALVLDAERENNDAA